MRTYLVIAIYTDNKQRFAGTYVAHTAEEAEKQAHIEAAKDGNELIIAGVLQFHETDLAYPARMSFVA